MQIVFIINIQISLLEEYLFTFFLPKVKDKQITDRIVVVEGGVEEERERRGGKGIGKGRGGNGKKNYCFCCCCCCCCCC